MIKYKILAINPGSTSTKIALYENEKVLFQTTIRHECEEFAGFENIAEQYSFRKDLIIKELSSNKVDINTINAIVGRGGLIKPVSSGVYEINSALISDLKKGILGEHASNLGGLIAHDIALSVNNAKAYIADPVVVDELQDVARLTGHPEFKRISIFHALNQKAVARKYAKSINKQYEELNLIVAHLGGGITVGAHKLGKVIDVNNAVDGDGPFSPERSGTLPTGQLVSLCFSGKYSHSEIKKILCGKGGLMAYAGTANVAEIIEKAKMGNNEYKLIYESMAYQIGKSIGEMATVLHGNVNAIIITGGIAYSNDIISYITNMTKFISDIVVYPGEDEMFALAMNGLSVLNGEIEVNEYI